jgi:hypothetical protein
MNQPKKQIKFQYGFKKWADETSIKFRADLNIKAHEPLCAFKLSDFLKIPIFTPENFSNLEKHHLDNLLGKGKEHWSAVTIPVSELGNIIIHNPTHSPLRQQSNIMHELAHVICGHKVSNEVIETGLIGFLRNHDIKQENEADWLGSSLQLPRQSLIWALKNNMTNDEISEYFNASIEMVKYRINITGVKKQIARWK